MKAKNLFLIWLITLVVFLIISILLNKFLNNDLIHDLLSLLLIIDVIAGVLSFLIGALLFFKANFSKKKKDKKDIKNKEIPIFKKKLVICFLTWFFSVILFYFLVTSESISNFTIILYLNILLGFVAGLYVIYYVAKVKGIIFSFLSGITLPVIALFSFFLLNKIISPYQKNLDTSKEVSPTPQLIECFIQGKSTFTTRENCIELSKLQNQQNHQIIIQQKPNFQLPPPPKIERFKIEPPIVRCDNEYDLLGNYRGVKCYKSWF